MVPGSDILGTHTARVLAERAAVPLLEIGRDKFTRRDFAKVDCFSYLAAKNLSYWLNKVLKVDDTRDVFEHVSPTEFAIPHVGPFSLAVLGAAFEIKGLGGDAPLESWLKRHTVSVVTFDTLKARELSEHQSASKAKRRRSAGRRDAAHRIRVSRFEARKRKGAAA